MNSDNKISLNLDLALTDTNAIGYALDKGGLSLSKTASEYKNDFVSYRNGLIAGNKNYFINHKEPLDALSLFAPFYYNPKYFLDKLSDSYIPKDKIKLLFDNYLKESGNKIEDIFKWYVKSMTVINYNFIKDAVTAEGNTIEYEVGDKCYIKIIEQPPAATDSSTGGNTSSSGGETVAPQPTYRYVGLFKHNKYIVYFNNNKVYLNNEDNYETKKNKDPNPNYTITKDDMEEILLNSIVFKFHYLQYGAVEYDDGSEILVKEKPYFFPGYGLHSSFFYNLMLNNLRAKIMTKEKEATESYISRYFYGYLHLCGVYFYKGFIRQEEFKQDEVTEDYFPYLNKDFYKTVMPDDFSTTDKSKDEEIKAEKEELKRNGL